MRPLSTPPSLLILTLLLLAPLGCDRDSAALLEARPDGPLVTGGQFPAHSRVFDGRDSLTTRPHGPLATKHNFAIVTQFIEVEGGDDVGRDGVTDPDNLAPSTPLFESRAGDPILAPDGDQVTWGEFSSARGAIIVKCTRRGTHSLTHLSGLIPKGVYSLWIDVFDSDKDGWSGSDRIDRFEYTATSKKGKRTRKRGKSKGNVFRASAQGEGHISGMVSPRTLGEVQISACMLDDVESEEYRWQAVAIYHIDGTPEVSEADEGAFVEQAGFTFEKEPENGEQDEDGESDG